jgi:hypothetical protein
MLLSLSCEIWLDGCSRPTHRQLGETANVNLARAECSTVNGAAGVVIIIMLVAVAVTLWSLRGIRAIETAPVP